MRADSRRGATLPLALALLAIAGVIAAATFVRERAVRRATVEVADLSRILEVAQSAQAEAVAGLRAGGDVSRAQRITPERTRAACGADAPWMEVGAVEVTPVSATTAADVKAGAAPHGVVEMSVHVSSSRGGARTVRQRRIYYFAGGRATLLAEPLGTVVE